MKIHEYRDKSPGRFWTRLLPLMLALLTVPAILSCRGREEPSGRCRGANVLLLVMDTTRADHLGCYGYFRSTSPFIDQLSGRSYLFEDAYASIPITLPSHASMLTGRYPQQHGALSNRGRVDAGQVSLAEILRQAGYRTGAVVGTAVLQKGTNLEQGFEAYLENWGISDRVPPPKKDEAWEFKGLAEDANRMALDWLSRDSEKPFFLMINYYDVHPPYVEIDEFKDLFDPYSPETEEYFRIHYDRIPQPQWKWKVIAYTDRSIAYLDSELSKFFDRLEEEGWLEDTIVILTADHGEGLRQHDDYGSHGEQLFEGHIRIPLIVGLPGGGSRRVRGLVETVDYAPTVLDLLGLPGLKNPDGRSFVPLLENRGEGKELVYAMNVPDDTADPPVPPLFSVGNSREKIIHQVGGSTLFFQLEEDPDELSGGRIPDDPGVRTRVDELLRRGEEWYQSARVKVGRAEEISPERVRALRSLGYLQ